MHGDDRVLNCCYAHHGGVPQAYKIIRSRETAGVSLLMHVAFAAGVAFWFTLGVMLWNWPMMIANALTFALTVIIITMKLYYG